MTTRRTVELVVRVLNEEGNLPALYDEVGRVFRDNISPASSE